MNLIRLIIFALLIYLAYRVIKQLGPSLFGSRGRSDAQDGNPPADTELVKDPQCGSYLLKQRGVKATVDGRELTFCSEECRRSYLERYESHQ